VGSSSDETLLNASATTESKVVETALEFPLVFWGDGLLESSFENVTSKTRQSGNSARIPEVGQYGLEESHQARPLTLGGDNINWYVDISTSTLREALKLNGEVPIVLPHHLSEQFLGPGKRLGGVVSSVVQTVELLGTLNVLFGPLVRQILFYEIPRTPKHKTVVI
jgi:hypothetical protein